MKLDELIFESVEPLVQPEVCKGLVFRGYNSTFLHDGRIEWRQGARLLKRKSCPGCEKCGFLWEDLRERCGDHQYGYPGIIFPNIENGAEYTVEVCNVSRDWESGIVDDWDLKITKLPALDGSELS